MDLATRPKARQRSREATLLRFLIDAEQDFTVAASESGMSADQFGAWIADEAETSITAVPGLSRLREVMHIKLSNAQEKWEGNDLNDWFYLSYAAAYFDLVVGEKKTSDFMRRAQRSSPAGGAVVHKYDEASAILSDLLKT